MKDKLQLYNQATIEISKVITKTYSTSFYFATRLLSKEKRKAIYSIYGFVRLADEIVDSFHNYNKKYLIEKFENDYYEAFEQGISINPVLNAFQNTVKKYNIQDEHIQSFLESMKVDLSKKEYREKSETKKYIYGSADVVGLMCLKVFCYKNDNLYQELEKSAEKLGSAFQKVNFIRDLKEDIYNLDRTYFPDVNIDNFNNNTKENIIKDIQNDFNEAYIGIKKLPEDSKLAVLTAFFYYNSLLKKIQKVRAEKIIKTRIRISNFKKILLLFKAVLIIRLKLV